MKYLLQQYEDGTFGYLGIDGNEHYNLTNHKLQKNQQKQLIFIMEMNNYASNTRTLQ